MPELPEVEAARVILAEHCEGRQITAVEALEDNKIFDGASPEDVATVFKGRTLNRVGRKGKNLWFTLSGSGSMPLVHFGMTGYIAVRDAADGKVHIVAYENAPQDTGSNWPPRFHKLLLHLGPHPNNPNSTACELAYCDSRRFGRVKLVEGDPESNAAITKLGFDPLLEMPKLDTFKELLAAKAKGAARLKPLLLDQTFCAGVGNWVADEVLWHARLHPEQPVAALQAEHVEALHAALQSVVQTAVAANADSSKFPPDWMFHVRWGKKAGALAGYKIDHITVGSRTSCYVPALQKLVGGGTSEGKKKPAAKQAGKGGKRKVKEQEDCESADDSNATNNSEGVQEGSGSEEEHTAALKRSKTAADTAASIRAKVKQPSKLQQQNPAAKQQRRRSKSGTAGQKKTQASEPASENDPAAGVAAMRNLKAGKAGTRWDGSKKKKS